MALLTLPSVPEKDTFQTYELNQADLISLIGEAYYQDKANWQKVVLTYVSSVSNQLSIITFTPDELQDTVSAQGYFAPQARDNFIVGNISIYDKQNGRFRLEASEIPNVSSYDINFFAAAYIRDFASPNALQSFETVSGMISYGDGVIQVQFVGGVGDGNYRNQANVAQFELGNSYSIRLYVADTNPGILVPSVSLRVGDSGYSSEVASFSGPEMQAAIGSFVEATFTVTASNITPNNIIGILSSAGSFESYLKISKIEVFNL